ncbi:MAG: cytochrome c oxidase accessory protein CcoG, partial [Gammaproteobacteria bacterium]|nr:cytochrome c oxidase accessory protein CcoG [Gammaproteobacteria bacterium]
LSMLLIIAAIALFMFTALAGRLWCGYACPQTVWTEIYMWFEQKIEGGSRKQKKRDQGPRDASYFAVKTTKHAVWLLFSLWTGFTFVGYFSPIQELWVNVLAWNLGGWEMFWIFFYGFATYGNAGFMREQVCIYMCPYARFQSAMFDHDTLIISYDEKRGNPRGSRKRGTPSADVGLGDCIDCGLCVQVCPVGIDIRDGLQYQCIGCAACIDVCDDVMDKMGYAKGLVKYTTENALEGKQTKIVRPRIMIYVGILTVVTAALVYGLLTRIPLEVDIIRDRNVLYTETDQGLVQNVYNLKIINMDAQTQNYTLSVSGLENIQIVGQTENIVIDSGAVYDLPLRVEVDPIELKSSSSDIYFHLESTTNPSISIDEHARFLGPVSR